MTIRMCSHTWQADEGQEQCKHRHEWPTGSLPQAASAHGRSAREPPAGRPSVRPHALCRSNVGVSKSSALVDTCQAELDDDDLGHVSFEGPYWISKSLYACADGCAYVLVALTPDQRCKFILAFIYAECIYRACLDLRSRGGSSMHA